MNTHNPHHFHMRPRRAVETTVVRTDFARPVTRTVTSDTLFRGDHEIGIEHHGALYRLKITRQGKLILNK
jgi:hemin uptake protein HemP